MGRAAGGYRETDAMLEVREKELRFARISAEEASRIYFFAEIVADMGEIYGRFGKAEEREQATAGAVEKRRRAFEQIQGSFAAVGHCAAVEEKEKKKRRQSPIR